MSSIMSEWITGAAHLVMSVLETCVVMVLGIVRATTADHLEGAAVMAVILLGPPLVVGLVRGFWQGLRIEWSQYRGKPRVIDGDTLEVRGQRIRLFGVDAPELGQPWRDAKDAEHDAGNAAKAALSSLIEGKRITVKALHEDQYKRLVAVVKVNGRDVARSLVIQGWAFAAPGSKRYRRIGQSARRRRRGFWKGQITMPWDYRAPA